MFIGTCPRPLRTKEMWGEAMRNWSWPSCIPYYLRTQETCNEIMRVMPDAFQWMFERFKTQGIC